MDRLKIETYIKGYEAAAPGRTLSVFSADEQYELAKLALQSLSQEAVRDEALENVLGIAGMLEFQAKLALDHGESDIKLDAATIVPKIVESLRALKREPNAAAESYEAAHPKALDEPAPAAPDVASMVKQWDSVKWSSDPTVIAEWAGQAAALLARLWQGWIPVSKRLPRDDFHVLVHSHWDICDYTAYLRDGKWKHACGDGSPRYEIRNVTHWMPLPKSPGASDE